MRLFILLALLGLSNLLHAQDTLKVAVQPAKPYPWSVLYQLKNVKQDYIGNKQVNKDSLFVYELKDLHPGILLLMYDMNAQNFVYFIYNRENIELEIFPLENNKVVIKNSKENKIFLPYAAKQKRLVYELNNLEKKLADNNITVQDKQTFKTLIKELKEIQKRYKKKSKGLLARKFILTMNEYYPSIDKPANEYFKEKKSKYFENIDFNDVDLQHTNIIIDKINTYVFDIDPPKNSKTKHLEYLKRIEYILPKIKDKTYRNNVIFSLTASFVNIDGRVSKTLIEKYIKKMPENERKKINIQAILDEIGITIGETAPDFEFDDLKGNTYNLHKITPKKAYTLLIFWGATCPHCLKSMPKIDKLMKNRNDFNVVAIGLEYEKYPWNGEHQYYPDFYHGIKLQKWENPIVKTYGIHATPTFFILNDKNEVIAKPYEVKDLEKWLKEHHNK